MQWFLKWKWHQGPDGQKEYCERMCDSGGSIGTENPEGFCCLHVDSPCSTPTPKLCFDCFPALFTNNYLHRILHLKVTMSMILCSLPQHPVLECYHYPEWLGWGVVMRLKSRVGAWRWGRCPPPPPHTQFQALGSLQPHLAQPNATLLSLHTHDLQQEFPDWRSPPINNCQALVSHLHR